MLSNIADIIGIITGIISLTGIIYIKRREIKIRFQSLLRFNKEIRLSYAYLYRIKFNNKYLLIKNNKIPEFKPLGGVFKYYSSFKNNMEEWKIKNDSVKNFYSDGDIRQIIKGKKLSAYIKWFDSRKNREVTVIRELVEELDLKQEIIYDILLNSEIEFIRQVKEPIKFSVYFQMEEQKTFEVYEVRFPGNINYQLFDSENFVLVNNEDLKRLKVDYNGVSYNLAETVKYIE